MKNKYLFIIIILTFLQVSITGQVVGFFPGEIYVKLSEDYPIILDQYPEDSINIPEQLSFLLPYVDSFTIYSVKRTFYFTTDPVLSRTLRLRCGYEINLNQLVSLLNGQPEVDYAEKIQATALDYTPDDLGSNTLNGQWGLYKIDAPTAWNISTGNPGAIVAILDNGFQLNHPDMSLLPGWDVADNDNDPSLPNINCDHGTHVAGISGANTDNALGLSSIGFGISIMPLKVSYSVWTPSQGGCNYVHKGYEGIVWAATHGARIINCSWGLGGYGYANTQLAAVNLAWNLGAVVVASAGNNNTNQLFYPASFPNVISVASTNISDHKSGFSNYHISVDVSAPGENILSLLPYNTYGIKSGTSMSAPIVSGLLGLILSANASMTNVDLVNCLVSTTDNIDLQNPAYIGLLGSGRINARKALLCAQSLITCDPCDNISFIAKEYDTCCYSLDLEYTCTQPFFTKIEFDILTSGVQFGLISLLPAWNVCASPTLTNVCIEPPSGLISPGSYTNLLSFCLTNIDQNTPMPQSVKVTYWTHDIIGQDSVACDTILMFNCYYSKKKCAKVTYDNIQCLEDSMKYKITVTVQNISSPPFTAYNLAMIGPGLTPNPVPLIPPLPNDGTTRTVTFCYTPNPWPDPDGQLILTYALKGLSGDTCCLGNEGLSDTLALPPCDTCQCLGFDQMTIYYTNGLGGWQIPIVCDSTGVDTLPCIPIGDVYHFKGNFLCSDSCNTTIDYDIISLSLNTSIQSGSILTTPVGNNVSQFDLTTGFQLIPGTYQLFLKGHCGGDYCVCVFDFYVPDCYPLCPDNLVQNPSFELYTQCPTSISNIHQASFWSTPTLGTPDYYNACAAYGSNTDVPNNFAGSQVPNSGTAYAGFIFFRSNTQKEYIETPLLSSLIPGMTYEISFYVSLAEGSRLAIDNIGAYLSNGPVGPTSNINPLNFTPHITSPPGIPITDKNGWTQIKGTVTPPTGSNYDHLVIGNFVNNTTFVNLAGGYLNDAYYYIDDVSVCKICTPQCDTCICNVPQMIIGYDNITYPVTCSPTGNPAPKIPCSNSDVVISGFFGCEDLSTSGACPETTVLWNLKGQNGITIISGTTTNYPAFIFPKSLVGTPGSYFLTLATLCPGSPDSCICTIEWIQLACDSCSCGHLLWADVYGISNVPQPILCNNTLLDLGCNRYGSSFFIHGDLNCMPDSCGNDTVFWLLDKPGTLPDLQGTSMSTYPHFDIGIPWNEFQQAGNYTLTISRYCGSKLCTCVFNFKVQICPCTCTSIRKDVRKGFFVIGSQLTCKRKLYPMKLCPNDMITWSVNGPGLNNSNYASSTGNSPISITFPPPGGTYTICMFVKRIDPFTGDTCFAQHCQKVIVKCKTFPPNTNPTITPCPGGDRLQNGDFTEGLITGHLGEGAKILDWDLIPNSGDGIALVDSSGASDDGHVILVGGKDNFAGIFQHVNLIGDSAFIGLYVINYLGSGAPSGTALEFRLQAEPIGGSSGQVIYRHLIDTSYSNWVDVSVALPVGINPSMQFLVICVQNESDEFLSVVGIDNIEFCTDETVSTVQQYPSTDIRIYPNPNNGDLTVDFSKPAPIGSKIRIIGLQGQSLLEYKISNDNPLQLLDVSRFPDGMYFLQINYDNRIMSINKFVKH